MLKFNRILNSTILSTHFNIYFIGLWGIQIVILLLYVSGMKELSQSFTIPYRILVSIISIYIFIKYNLVRTLLKKTTLRLIFLFYSLIIIRIISDAYIYQKNLGTTGESYLLRFGSMVIVQSLAFLLALNNNTAERAKNGLKYACIIFLIIGFYLYRDALKFDYRTLQHFAGWDLDNLISPMAFSYIGLTLSGIILWEIFYQNKFGIRNAIFLIIALFALIWGGTRNSILALIMVFAFITIQKSNGFKSLIRVISLWIILGIGGIYILRFSSSSILNRFEQLAEELSHGDMNAGSYRLTIWINGWKQFTSSPIFGSGIEEANAKYVAHNMYLESVMATGLLGGSLFFLIIFFTYKNGYFLLKSNSTLGWLMILFLERTFTGMMSTSILDPIFWLPIIAINANTNKIK